MEIVKIKIDDLKTYEKNDYIYDGYGNGILLRCLPKNRNRW